MNNFDRQVLLALAEVATPAGEHVQAAGAFLLSEVENVVADLYGPNGQGIYRRLLQSIEMAAVPLSGRRLSKLSLEKRAKVLARLHENPAMHWPLRAVTAPIKAAQARHPSLLRAIGANTASLAVADEKRRWHSQVIDARTLSEDEEIEVDVVVVGTGAGGAPVANKLAAAGHAVLMVEEGGHHTRGSFDGRGLKSQRSMFRQGGLQVALGNTAIPVPTGQTVGGSTTINSGTCYRIPERVQRRWVLENGLHDLGPGSLDSHFESAEKMLQVTAASEETLGGCARVIARGAEALGYEHGPLLRNAPACDGQGVCCFGCPTDAKRSTNVSYVPAAIENGAMVYCNAHVTDILTERGRAVGVEAVAQLKYGHTRTLRVRAKAVVLAGGALGTPAMLLGSGLANRSGQVGKQLSVHPATYAWARFDEDIRGWSAIPQGYAIDEFVEQGLRFEGVFLPPDMAAASMSQIGPRWTDIIENFHKLACFGFMVADSSRGRVILGRDGTPQIRYSLNEADRKQMIRGQAILARVYLAAGARAIYPALSAPWDAIHSEADVVRFEREAQRKLKARHINMSAFHPLGSCRMHGDPRRGVTSATGETHQVANLFICDGSAVPGPLGVNPQLTIMALAERSAQFVERRIEEQRPDVDPTSVSVPADTGLEFSEVMSGSMTIEDGEEVDVEFEVRATQEADEPGLDAEVSFALEGMLRFPTLAKAAPCHGTLLMRPLERHATLTYTLDFQSDDGRSLQLRGSKDVGILSVLRGMTTLHTTLWHEEDIVARGILRFDIRDLPGWLGTFRLLRSDS
ncbi:MAG: GMC family oxidoreductase [Myxococcales bacterium]|nr:GMC family oxidoreductase [Myxococcales bacterium]